MLAITKGVLLTAVLLLIPRLSVAMELWPESFDVQIAAGEEGYAQLMLANESSVPLNYRIDLLQVQIGETRDDLSFSALNEEIASWIRIDDDTLSLAANTQGVIGLTIAPPEDVISQVVTIGVYVEEQSSEVSGIGVQTAVVSLGFITVGSPTQEYHWLSTQIETASGWSLPVTSHVSVRNEGERVVIPQGTMRIASLLGRTIDVVSVNETGNRVLSGQSRTFTTQWGRQEEEKLSPLAIGIFTVDLELVPWENGDVFHARRHIILFPWKATLIAVVIMAVLVWLHRFSRGPKRRV